jgi:hypothetical protein
VDGGQAYLRRTGSFEDLEEMSITIDDELGQKLRDVTQPMSSDGNHEAIFLLFKSQLYSDGYNEAFIAIDEDRELQEKMRQAALESVSPSRNGWGVVCAIIRAIRDAGRRDILDMLAVKLREEEADKRDDREKREKAKELLEEDPAFKAAVEEIAIAASIFKRVAVLATEGRLAPERIAPLHNKLKELVGEELFAAIREEVNANTD